MIKFTHRLIQDPTLYQYILVGGIAALVDLSLFFSLKHYFAIHYLVIATVTFFVATLINFLLCNYFVFKFAQRRSQKTRIILTYAVSFIGLLIHHSCLFVAFELMLFPLLVSKIFAMGTAFAWNFLSRRHLVFTPA